MIKLKAAKLTVYSIKKKLLLLFTTPPELKDAAKNLNPTKPKHIQRFFQIVFKKECLKTNVRNFFAIFFFLKNVCSMVKTEKKLNYIYAVTVFNAEKLDYQ